MDPTQKAAAMENLYQSAQACLRMAEQNEKDVIHHEKRLVQYRTSLEYNKAQAAAFIAAYELLEKS